MHDLLDKANIDNLTGLWHLMGTTEVQSGWQRSVGWPRRCWRNWEQRGELLDSDMLDAIPSGYLHPVWQAGEKTAEQEQQLRLQGLEVGLEQLAMVLPLDRELPVIDRPSLQLSQIESRDNAEVWADLCGRAFGYALDAGVIDRLRLQPDVDVLWAMRNGLPLATAILYRTGPIMGVHQVGVPPEFQGQGIARELMHALLVRAQVSGGEHVCLQASAAGEPLYLGLGFQPRFRICSYRRA